MVGVGGCSVECWSAPPPHGSLTSSAPALVRTLLPYLQSSTSSLSSFSHWGSRAGSLGFLMDFRVSRLAFCPAGEKQKVSIWRLICRRGYRADWPKMLSVRTWGPLGKPQDVSPKLSHVLARLGSPQPSPLPNRINSRKEPGQGRTVRVSYSLDPGHCFCKCTKSYLRWRQQGALLPKNVQ